MDLLVYLAKRSGEVVPKEEILKAVWAGAAVSDDALTRCVAEIRHAVHDTAHQPVFLETIPKRGYRILPPVAWDSGSDGKTGARPARNRRWVAAAAVFVLLACALAGVRAVWRSGAGRTEIESIAVLPLIEIDGEPEQDYLADGFTEGLIGELARSGVRVASWTSAMRYKGTPLPLRQIARELHVDGVIEGTVVRSPDGVRIAVRLIDPATGVHRWADSFEGEMADVLRLQAGIARSVTSELGVSLGAGDRSRVERTPKVVPEAYEDYLKGMHFCRKNQWEKAGSYLEQSVRKDPTNKLAFALLFEADSMVAFSSDAPVSNRARNALERALQLDRDLAEAHMAIGDLEFAWEWDWAAAGAAYRRAVNLDRRSVEAAARYARFLHVLARWEPALRECQRGLQIDPVSQRMNESMIGILIDMHRWDDAREAYRKTTELYPDSSSAPIAGGLIHTSLGHEKEALSAYLVADRLSGKTPEQVASLERAAKTTGARGYWLERLRQLEERSGRSRVPPLDFASEHVLAGNYDTAIQWLEAAYRERAPRLIWLRAAAKWDPLRNHPRFQALIAKMAFPK